MDVERGYGVCGIEPLKEMNTANVGNEECQKIHGKEYTSRLESGNWIR